MTVSAPVPFSPSVTAQPERQTEHDHLRAVAQELEAAFLSEMLKHAGLGAPRGHFGGGAGEDQVASLLRTEQARAMTERGGLGLAESLFNALVARAGSDGGRS